MDFSTGKQPPAVLSRGDAAAAVVTVSPKRDGDDGFSARKEKARRVLHSTFFDVAMGFVISTNALTIGIEQTLNLNGEDTTSVQLLENFFLAIYIVELMMRFFAFSWGTLKDHWVKLDFFIVVMGILTNWIIEPMTENQSNGFSPLMVLRLTRLLRLAKMMRALSRFPEFLMLLRGLLNSANVMLSTMLLLIFILYVGACIGLELITKHRYNIGPDADEGFQDHVEKYFNNLPNTMLTLVQLACLDNMSAIYYPLVSKDGWLSCYFLFIVLFVGIVVQNLVAAVMVTRSLEQNLLDKDAIKNQEEERLDRLVGEVKEMLIGYDLDQSGSLSRTEIQRISNALAARDRISLCEAMRVDTPMEIFETLDVDNSGKLSINEFCDGIWQDLKAKASLEAKRMQKQVDAMHFRLKEDLAAERSILCIEQEIQVALGKITTDIEALAEVTKEMLMRIEVVDPVMAKKCKRMSIFGHNGDNVNNIQERRGSFVIDHAEAIPESPIVPFERAMKVDSHETPHRRASLVIVKAAARAVPKPSPACGSPTVKRPNSPKATITAKARSSSGSTCSSRGHASGHAQGGA